MITYLYKKLDPIELGDLVEFDGDMCLVARRTAYRDPDDNERFTLESYDIYMLIRIDDCFAISEYEDMEVLAEDCHLIRKGSELKIVDIEE